MCCAQHILFCIEGSKNTISRVGLIMYPDFSVRRYSQELCRPWKVVTFILAFSYYVLGALYYRLPTWDVPVSIIMSVLAYVFAPWIVMSLLFRGSNRL